MSTSTLALVAEIDVAVTPSDRAEIVDALFRFGAGQDLRDRALFDSAFAPNAKLDFTQPARKLSVEVPMLEGRESIGDAIFASIAALDTTHTITNPRVTAFDGEHATLFALVEAQHLPRDDHSRHLLLKNVYETKLSRAGANWVVDHMRIRNVWLSGDSSLLFPTGPAARPNARSRHVTRRRKDPSSGRRADAC